MKKSSAIYLCALFFGLFALSLTSCSDDDGIVDYDQVPYLRYNLEVGANFMQFYDVTITYKSADGKDIHTEKLNTQRWVQRMENKSAGDPEFYYIITAKARDNYNISSSTPWYDMNYSYGVSWYTKSTGAKEYNQAGGGRISHSDMQEYINSHQTIEICNITMKPGMDE